MIKGDLALAWKQRCKHEGNWYLTKAQQYWLTVKCMICMVLDLNRFPDPEDWGGEHVCVAITEAHSYPCEWGTCSDWTELRVGKGFLSNWYFYYESDGAP